MPNSVWELRFLGILRVPSTLPAYGGAQEVTK